MRTLLSILFIVYTTYFSFAQLQSPDEFLPHKLGEHFTPHHLLVDYFEHMADNSPLVKLVQYGTTNQDRPLFVAIITSEENHANLEEIRQNNLRLAHSVKGDGDSESAKGIVWLSFSVHGNEAAGSEASHQVVYDLANPNNSKTKTWLENTVILLDPSINPDGYSRYTHWVRNVTMDENNPDLQDIEHQEPWPGGRVNHYLFDLNRDWAWQTQVESQQRLKLYHQWLPHVHADLHEMGHESSYYFAPAAKPYHKYITQWQRDFQHTIGKNHAKYFDEQGWLYFTKEVFDLFYPSYGDTYPMAMGAIGMTYEQGGSSRGGRGVKTQNGEILTLKDRVEHHTTAALSTVEVTSVNASEVIDEFKSFYDRSMNDPVGEYKTYVVKKDESGNRLRALCNLLDAQQINYGTVSEKKKVSGLDYHSRTEGSVEVVPGDLVVSAYQSKSMLAQILLNPENELEDSLTYDITAWSLPYAYGLHALASRERLDPDMVLTSDNPNQSIVKSYAYLLPWNSLEDAKLTAQLVKQGIDLRIIPKKSTFGGKTFDPGTVLLSWADNRSIGDELLSKITEAMKGSTSNLAAIESGFADAGHDLGSNRIDLIKKPKVMVLMGDGVSQYSYGQVKWYFDRVIDYPMSSVKRSSLGRVDFSKYNTIILPDGRYSLKDDEISKIKEWVTAGGKLIAIGGANRLLVDKEGFALKMYATDEEKTEDKKASKEEELQARYNHHSENERRSISNAVPGAIFALQVDETHPLGFGLGKQYYSLRTSRNSYPLIVDESNVITHPKAGGQVFGFAGAKVKEKLKDTVAFAVENKGRGQVVYMVDNPLYRGFWYNGLFLFSNALFMVN